jgi:AcrR family transcriptional regulator
MHTDSTEVNRKQAQSLATQAKLVRVARQLFAERGYANVGTEEIVRSAGVTRGALYHQYADKRDLFRAVFEQVEADVIGEIAAGALGGDDPLQALRQGCALWLDACARPEVHRIVLMDAPVVLGWEEWRAIGERHSFGVVAATLQHAMETGAIARQPVRALTHFVIGALDEVALYIASSEDRDAARADVTEVLDRLVESLRPR